jgi:hypothetical protein
LINWQLWDADFRGLSPSDWEVGASSKIVEEESFGSKCVREWKVEGRSSSEGVLL